MIWIINWTEENDRSTKSTINSSERRNPKEVKDEEFIDDMH